MVQRLINRWRAFVARHTFCYNEPIDIQSLDWNDVLRQAKAHHDEVLEDTMAHKEKQYNTPQPFPDVKSMNIKAMFEARDEAYNSCTNIILDNLRATLMQGVLEYFNLEEQYVTWVHISMNADIGMVTMIGTIAEGSDVQETHPQPVNSEMGELPTTSGPRYVRVAIPLDKMEGATKQTVLDYFKGLEDNESVMEQQAMDMLSKQIGFNLAELSEDQRDRLLMTLNASSDEAQTQQ